MDPHQEKIPSVKEAPLNPRHLTIMVIRSVGKIRTFKVSRRLIFWSSLFIIAYIISSIYFINRFFDLRYRYRIQSERLELLEKDHLKTGKKLLRTRQHVAILEDYIQNIQEQRVPEKVTEPEKKQEAEIVDRVAEVVNDESKGEKDLSEVAQIEDLVVQEVDSGMSFDFKLVNAKPDEDAIEGYIHIIAMDIEKNTTPEWNSTNDTLKDGFPINFRHGQQFLIQRFKPYHRTFNYNSNSELPSTIRILVYNRSGTLILKKEYKVSNES